MRERVNTLAKVLVAVLLVVYMAAFLPVLIPGSVPRQGLGAWSVWSAWAGRHPERSFQICFGLVLVYFAAVALMLRSRPAIFPPTEPVDVRFRETGASGRGTAGWWPVGGASRCLEVLVTQDELWTRLSFPFSLFTDGRECGLANRIPITRITGVALKKRFLNNSLVVDYHDAGGASQHLRLNLRAPEALMEALSWKPKA